MAMTPEWIAETVRRHEELDDRIRSAFARRWSGSVVAWALEGDSIRVTYDGHKGQATLRMHISTLQGGLNQEGTCI